MDAKARGLDEKDEKILEMLMRNSRISYTDLARIVGLSDVAVIKRIKKLEDAGVIKSYTIVVDPSKIGYKLTCFTGINVQPQELFHVLEELKKIPNIKYIAMTSGDHHIMAIIWARDQEELTEIHEKILGIKGVEKVYPAIKLQEVKGPICL